MEKERAALKILSTWFKVKVATLQTSCFVQIFYFKDEHLNFKGGMEKQSLVLEI